MSGTQTESSLSQQEAVNLLLDTQAPEKASEEVQEPTAETEVEATETEEDDKSYRLYDFKRPNHLDKSLRNKLSNFAKKFEEEFFRELVQTTKTNTSISFHSLDELLYSDYLLGLTNPISFNVLKVNSSPVPIIATLDPSILIAFVKSNKSIAEVTASDF